MNCAELTFTASATEQNVEEEETKRRSKKIPPEKGEKLYNVKKKIKYSLSSLRVMVQHL